MDTISMLGWLGGRVVSLLYLGAKGPVGDAVG